MKITHPFCDLLGSASCVPCENRFDDGVPNPSAVAPPVVRLSVDPACRVFVVLASPDDLSTNVSSFVSFGTVLSVGETAIKKYKTYIPDKKRVFQLL